MMTYSWAHGYKSGQPCLAAGAESPLKMDALLLALKYNNAARWHTVVICHVLKYHVRRFESKSFSIQAAEGDSSFKNRRSE